MTLIYKIVLIILVMGISFGSKFVFMATTNVVGETEPCGWKKKPLGGLARKATVINDVKSEGVNPFIVDAGDLFFKDDGKTTPSLIAPETIVESYNWMGCHAFSPGSKDFALGRNFLEDLENKSTFPYISCNIYSLDSKRLFEPYVEYEADGTKIIIIGAASSFNSDNILVTDPIKELELLVPMLKQSSSDFVLLLFNGSEVDMNRLQNSNINIDLVVRSKKKTRSSDGGTKRIPVYMAGDRGKYVYRIDVNWNKEGGIVDIPRQNSLIRLAKNRLNRMKKEGYALEQLEEAYKDNPDALKKVLHYKSQIADAEKKISSSSSSLNMEKIELGKKVMDTPEVLAIVDRGIKREKDGQLPPNQTK